ncbi:DUF397 domain-containing protein [Nocardia uniformis]|uniref:DUF397 domain-containing protein n=2 Tax=Nocardia uniformis TaxID=53432 RepID=A0A849CGE8_9NOCA|nr:DUF397 domain-containing protein [Nocardia uniformis]NNH76050.1 DUF397 domain-containing protein [Nocardia uniformis]
MNTSTTAPRSGWFKASFSSQSSNCVEVRFGEASVLIRDSKYHGDPFRQPVVSIPTAIWESFLKIVTGTPVDATVIQRLPVIDRDEGTGRTAIRDLHGVCLVYTADEWMAFTAGIYAGEFTPAAA